MRKIYRQDFRLARLENKNTLLIFRDDIQFRQTPKLLLALAQLWKFIKVGHGGSSIETEADGWLLSRNSFAIVFLHELLE